MKNLRRARFEVTRLLRKIGKVRQILTRGLYNGFPFKCVYELCVCLDYEDQPSNPVSDFGQSAGQMRTAAVAPHSGGVRTIHKQTYAQKYVDTYITPVCMLSFKMGLMLWVHQSSGEIPPEVESAGIHYEC